MKDMTVKELVYDDFQPLSTKTPSLFNQELSLSNSEKKNLNIQLVVSENWLITRRQRIRS